MKQHTAQGARRTHYRAPWRSQLKTLKHGDRVLVEFAGTLRHATYHSLQQQKGTTTITITFPRKPARHVVNGRPHYSATSTPTFELPSTAFKGRAPEKRNNHA